MRPILGDAVALGDSDNSLHGSAVAAQARPASDKPSRIVSSSRKISLVLLVVQPRFSFEHLIDDGEHRDHRLQLLGRQSLHALAQCRRPL